MKIRTFLIMVIFSITTILFSCTGAQKDTTVKNKARLIFSIGQVSILENRKWVPAKEQMELTEGHEIKTGNQSQCNIVVGNNSYISIKEKSHLVLSSLFKDVSGIEKTSVELKLGKSVLNPKKLLKGESFQVKTPTAIAAVRGTRFVVQSNTKGKMKVAVVDGKVELKRRIPALEKVEGKVVERSEVLSGLQEKVKVEAVVVSANESAFIDNKKAIQENSVIEESITEHVEEVKTAIAEEETKKPTKANDIKKGAQTKSPEKIKDISLENKLKSLQVMKVATPKAKAAAPVITLKKSITREDAKDVKDLDSVKKKVEKKEKETKKVTALIISSPRKSSRIYANGLYAGVGKVTLNPDANADVLVEVKTRGFEVYRTEVSVNEGESKRIVAKLTVAARLTIETPVKYSRIIINGKYAGRGKVTVQPGSGKAIDVVVIARGFKKYETELELDAGETKAIKVALEKSRELSRVRWSSKVGSAVNVNPVYYSNMLIIATNDGYVVAINKKGKRVWKTNLKRRIESTPVVERGSLFVVTNNGGFYSLKASNGKVQWKKKLFGSLLFGSKPIIRNKRIYLATSFGRLYSFKLSGKQLWSRDIENGIYSSPAYYKGKLYVGAEDHNIYAMNASDGNIEWKYKADGRLVSSSPVISRNKLYVGSYKGTFYSLDANNGDLLWKYKTGDSIFSSPLVYKNNVYFGSNDGYLYKLNSSTGKIKWKYRSGRKIVTQPTRLKNTIIITSGKRVIALSNASGKVQWTHEFNKTIKTSAMVVGDEIFLGLENGQFASVRGSLKEIYQ